MSDDAGYKRWSTDRRTDPRGALAELVRDLPAGTQLYVFTISPGQSRGGHWHRRKMEWFVCLAGSTSLVLEPHEGADPPEVLNLTGDFSEVVQVMPGTRHTFKSDAGATIVACISESFDPADPDTYFPDSHP